MNVWVDNIAESCFSTTATAMAGAHGTAAFTITPSKSTYVSATSITNAVGLTWYPLNTPLTGSYVTVQITANGGDTWVGLREFGIATQ